jgi:hypothetical protein
MVKPEKSRDDITRRRKDAKIQTRSHNVTVTGYCNAPQCYVIRTLPVLLIISHVFSLGKLMCHVPRLHGDCSAGLVFMVLVSICTSLMFPPSEEFSWFYWKRFCVQNWEHSIFFLISNFRRVPNVEFFLLDDSPASEFYVSAFRNTSIFIGGV